MSEKGKNCHPVKGWGTRTNTNKTRSLPPIWPGVYVWLLV